MIFRVGDHGDIFFWGRGTGLHHVPTRAPPTTTTTTTTTTKTTSDTTNPKKVNISQIDSLVNESIEKSEKQYNTDVETYKVTNNGFTQKAEDDLVIGIMTSAGYFFILIILMVGIALGDNEDNGMVHTVIIKINDKERKNSPLISFCYSIFLGVCFSWQLVRSKYMCTEMLHR